MSSIHFLGPLVKRGNYYCVEFPRFLSGEIHSRSRVKVKGTVNGGDYEGSAFPTGDGRHFIMINARMRHSLSLQEGEEVVIILDQVGLEPEFES